MKWLLTNLVLVLFILTICQGYLVSKRCECGTSVPTNRIVNGRETKPHQYPWTVAIAVFGEINCGGAIINNRYIVTAGHCVKWSPLNVTYIYTGIHNIVREVSEARTYRVIETKIHFNFTSYALHDDNDIALIKVDRPITFNDHVRPICLPVKDNTYDNQIATVAGWGKLGEELPTSATLQETFVKLLTEKECRKTEMKDFVNPTVMCALGEDTDSCQGDSGGPLIYEKAPGKYELIGVVSWGNGCNSDDPGIYTKVSYYVDWIYENTKDAVYCSDSTSLKSMFSWQMD